jgi:hypothetical protein
MRLAFKPDLLVPAPHPSYTRDTMKVRSIVLTSVNNEIIWKEVAFNN